MSARGEGIKRMKMVFGQLFYGAGPRGYEVLAASPSAAGFESAATALCGTIGAPRLTPECGFLLASKPVEGRVIMVRGCDGAPDTNGRRTMLFHCLVAARDVVDGSSVDAFTLAGAGVFKSSLPGIPLEDVTVEVDSSAKEYPAAPFEIELPGVLRLPAQNISMVRALLGVKANSVAWTTLAESANPAFDLCVVDMYAALPAGRPVYGEKGLFRKAEQGPSSARSGAVRDGEDPGSSGSLRVFVLINLVFSIACIALSIRSCVGDSSSSDDSGSKVVRRQRVEIESLRRELDAANSRLSEFRKAISDFSKENKGVAPSWGDLYGRSRFLKRMEAQLSEKVYPADGEVFLQMKSCVDFAKRLSTIDSGEVKK